MMRLKITNSLKIFAVCLIVGFPLLTAFAAEKNKEIVALTKQIMEAKSNSELYAGFEKLKESYFKDNKYADFIDLAGSLSSQKKALLPLTNYYIALARYNQLKYLEKIQDWNEYFTKGELYREEINKNVTAAINNSSTKDILNLSARLLLWQFDKEQNNPSLEKSLTDLMDVALEYSKAAGDLSIVKTVADSLFASGEKIKARQLYKIYTENLISSAANIQDLKQSADTFYKENNLELSEIIFDAYIDKAIELEAKEILLPQLIEIARKFAYSPKLDLLDNAALKDPFYAEKVFQKIELLGGKNSFDESLLYLRAFNLEKAKDYKLAKDFYSRLLERYPAGSYADEANFKCGIIYTYILADLATGKLYFEKLAGRDEVNPYIISSLYQLGLLNQWEENFAKAKEYYDKLRQKAGEGFKQMLVSVEERTQEIEEPQGLGPNLKAFLDTVFKKDDPSRANLPNADLKSSPFIGKVNTTFNITADFSPGESGCLPVQLEYLWSGDTANSQPSQDISFTVQYSEPGTKVINLVISSPNGIIASGIELVDVK